MAAALTLLLVVVPTAIGAGSAAAPQVAPLGVGPQSKAQAPAAALAPSGPGGGESSAPAPTTGVSFVSTTGATGGESTFIPPDTTGDVGPSRIAVPLNGRMKIFDKTGTQLYSDTLNNFFASVRNGQNAFDSRVEYDRLSGRWFITAINGTDPNNRVMIAYSSGPTINGIADFTFTFFDHDAPTGSFGDYTTLGVDKNALYIGTNNFAPGYTGSSLYVLDKADLLGGTITRTSFNVGTASTGMFAPHVAHNDDPNATVGYLVGVDNAAFGVIDVRRVLDPAGTPTLTAQQQITVPTTSFSCNVPTMGSTAGLGMDALDDRLYEPMVQKDPTSGTDRLWTAHNLTVNASGTSVAGSGSSDCAGAQRIASRYYELGNLSTTPSLIQSGTLFDPAATNPDSFWIPSIAANAQGHAVMGSTIGGPARFAGISLVQRFNGEPAGALSSVLVAQAGAASYTVDFGSGRNRWGDYSQVVIDPNDDMTFWTFQEYVSATNQWAVRVIQVKAPPPATPASASGPVQAGQASTPVTITGTSTNGSGFFDPGPDTGGPGFANDISATVSGGVTVNSVTVNSPTSLTLSLNTTAAPVGTKDVTITNPDGQIATGAGILTVAAPAPAAPSLTSTSPASGANDNNPEIVGSASAGTTVNLFQTNNCSGAVEASGSAAQLASPGLTASVADNTTSQFSATATNGNGTSACSNSIAYTEVTPGTPPPTARCAGRNATKVGTAGANVINGTAGRDIIAGLGGNDTIRGRGGNDLVCGGAGRDKEVGGAGRDTLLGQAGNDRLLGGAGRDILRGAAGRDTLIGGPGVDVLSGGPGVDVQIQ